MEPLGGVVFAKALLASWDFPKIRVPYCGFLIFLDPTIQRTIARSPIFENPHHGAVATGFRALRFRLSPFSSLSV